MNIVVIETPFHLYVFKHVCKTMFTDELHLVFYSDYVDLKELKKLENVVSLIKIPVSSIRYQNFFITTIFHLFSYYVKSKVLIKSEVCESNYNKVIIFNDRQLFNQILVKYIYTDSLDVILIDEGVGLYREYRKFTYKHIVYFFSFFLFRGRRLHYSNRLGDFHLVNKVYSRCPDYIENKRKNVEYVKLNLENNKSEKYDILKGHVFGNELLFISSTLSEDCLFSKNEEFEILDSLFNKFKSMGYDIYLKPHPRENLNKYSLFVVKYDLNIIDSKISFESINYSDFATLFSFMSSSILDVISAGYNLSNVYTFIVPGNNELIHLFQNTKIVNCDC